ncbi:uncharacterized protein LOC135057963 [Pseudophryne corroboree]|uniref:uncharacterized protein LOC135057963 n=1 Tax=Pseudophryne corroboree TaxID=495146 RepID=UPI003081EB16
MLRLHIIYLISLTLFGVRSESKLFGAQCNNSEDNQNIKCGDDMQVTCNMTHQDYDAKLLQDEKPIVNISLLKGNFSKDISIVMSEDKLQLKITIHNIKFSSKVKYLLWFTAWNGYIKIPINIKVSGVCDPEISFRNDELTCEVESHKELLVTWKDSNSTIFPGKNETNKLNKGFKLFSSLKRTNYNSKLQICCSVFDEEEKITCLPQSEGSHSEEETKVSYFIILPLVAVLALFCFLALRGINRRPIRSAEESEFSTFPWRNSVYQGFQRLRENVILRVVSVENPHENQGQSPETSIELIPAMPTEQV